MLFKSGLTRLPYKWNFGQKHMSDKPTYQPSEIESLKELPQSCSSFARNLVACELVRFEGTDAHHLVPAALKFVWHRFQCNFVRVAEIVHHTCDVSGGTTVQGK
jgi:hypothetical protein